MPENRISPTVEPIHTYRSHLLCWRSIVAGLLIAMMAHMILSSLGVGIIGVAAQSAIENEEGGLLLASGMGIWMALSTIVALFLGSYFAVRISKSVTNKVAAAHGFVISSAFFIILTVLASGALGSFSMGLGQVFSGVGKGSVALAENSRVQDTINSAIGTTNLKSEPAVVAQGIAVRLLQGDTESAKAYYAYQSGLSQAEVSSRIDRLNAEFIATAKEVGDKTAKAATGTGITLFAFFLLGVLSAMFGGRYASHANVTRPLEAPEVSRSTMHSRTFANQHGSAMP